MSTSLSFLDYRNNYDPVNQAFINPPARITVVPPSHNEKRFPDPYLYYNSHVSRFEIGHPKKIASFQLRSGKEIRPPHSIMVVDPLKVESPYLLIPCYVLKSSNTAKTKLKSSPQYERDLAGNRVVRLSRLDDTAEELDPELHPVYPLRDTAKKIKKISRHSNRPAQHVQEEKNFFSKLLEMFADNQKEYFVSRSLF